MTRLSGRGRRDPEQGEMGQHDGLDFLKSAVLAQLDELYRTELLFEANFVVMEGGGNDRILKIQ